MTRWILAMLMTAAVTLPGGTLLAQDAGAKPATPSEDEPAVSPEAAEPAEAATQPAPIPQAVIQQIYEAHRAPAGDMSPEEKRVHITQSADEIIELGVAAEEKYPDAPNLYLVQAMMLEAAAWLAREKDTPKAQARLDRLAEAVATAEGAPLQLRFPADRRRVEQKLGRLRATTRPADAAKRGAKAVREFVKRYRETDAALPAIASGAMWAQRLDDDKLLKHYADLLEQDYADQPGVQGLLRRLGRSPYVGKTFEAELPKLGGGTLTLPDDMKGKVVVIDFWATWCGPCIRAMPHMKEVYEKYHPRGVEFIGLSLDESREKLTGWLEENDIPWTITFTGDGWEDPTANKYGVSGIPSVWVIGKDGKVVSDSARGELSETLDKALSAE
ncbi:MAG: TlpA family protein disulfide reductase [Planctomycetota bacterium]